MLANASVDYVPASVLTLNLDAVITGLREQVEFDHAKAFPFQANLPDELTHFPPQT